MLQRLRESKSAQGTFLALPTTIWLFILLIIPLILTLIVSFGKRTPDGGVIYTFTLDNYTRLFGYSTDCSDGQAALLYCTCPSQTTEYVSLHGFDPSVDQFRYPRLCMDDAVTQGGCDQYHYWLGDEFVEYPIHTA